MSIDSWTDYWVMCAAALMAYAGLVTILYNWRMAILLTAVVTMVSVLPTALMTAVLINL